MWHVPCCRSPYGAKRDTSSKHKLRSQRMMISTADTDVLSALSNQMADAVARVRPALVLVNGRQRQPASGIVFAPDLVLTADHVIDREEDLTIETDDGRSLP